MRILILGGDGYIGWATAMYFSSLGHQIALIDNNSRRKICETQNIKFLFDVPDLKGRVKLWESLTGNKIKFNQALPEGSHMGSLLNLKRMVL